VGEEDSVVSVVGMNYDYGRFWVAIKAFWLYIGWIVGRYMPVDTRFKMVTFHGLCL
jgi:hypothetical protein